MDIHRTLFVILVKKTIQESRFTFFGSEVFKLNVLWIFYNKLINKCSLNLFCKISSKFEIKIVKISF